MPRLAELHHDPPRFLSDLAAQEPALAAFVDDAYRGQAELYARERQLSGGLAAANERVRLLERQLRSSRWIFKAAGMKVLGFPTAELRRLWQRLGGR